MWHKSVHMRFFLLSLSVLLLFFACNPPHKSVTAIPPYPANVGDIAPDPMLDDTTFRTCRGVNIPQYYSVNSGYEGEKPAVDRYFEENFKYNPAYAAENGYVTIRFVVNCNGRTGRFRVMEMDANYQPKKFPAAFSGQLLQLTQQMTGWLPGKSENIPYDYYQYLCFAIEKGKIARIMP